MFTEHTCQFLFIIYTRYPLHALLLSSKLCAYSASCSGTTFSEHETEYAHSLCISESTCNNLHEVGPNDFSDCVSGNYHCVVFEYIYDPKKHKRLKERFLIRRNRTKRAHFLGKPLFQATYNNITTTKKQRQQLNQLILCPFDAGS